MLTKLITLYVIDEIFSSCKIKLSPTTKMLYINCLSHNFKSKEISLPNLNDFILIKAEIPNHNAFQEHFICLCKAGLITDEGYSYKFISHWIKHIELGRINQYQETKGQSKVELSKAETEFYSSTQLVELCQMKYHLNKAQVHGLMKQFIQEQVVSDKTYTNIGDAKKHFIYWCANNKDKAPQEAIVKSKSKILGL